MISISPVVFDLADAPQLLAQNLHFARELKLVRRVLIVAAAAAREQRARRRDALGRGRDDTPLDRRGRLVDLAEAHDLARQHERRQHHAPVRRAPGLAAIHPLFNT